jgi:phage tail sheath protein FI
MPFQPKTPGVYREDVLLAPAAALPTGVPGFVGFITTAESGAVAPDVPVVLHRKDEFDTRFRSAPGGYLGDAVAGFFGNGGTRCYVVNANPTLDRETALTNALEALAPLDDLDLVAVPDAMTLVNNNKLPDVDAITRVQQRTLMHCERHHNRLAILDALPAADRASVLAQRDAITTGVRDPVDGALYFPWLKLEGGRVVPPSGHVAGVYARTDLKTGVFKAPANEQLRGVLDLASKVDDQLQAELNPAGVNCLRVFPGRGLRVWGARTLSRAAEWRYVHVRRIFITLERWIERNFGWTTFEANTPRAWVRIRRELDAYLAGLWAAGALVGATAAEAYYVKCDEETNPPAVREAGQTITEIGLAPVAPAEFIVVRIIHRLGPAEIV